MYVCLYAILCTTPMYIIDFGYIHNCAAIAILRIKPTAFDHYNEGASFII